MRDEDEDEEGYKYGYVKKGEECITCEKGRDVVCIGDKHFGFCDEGCVEKRRLGVGVRCVDGRIYGA